MSKVKSAKKAKVVTTVKLRIFWNANCEDFQKSTMTEIKPEEEFKLTGWVKEVKVKNKVKDIPVYSLRRGTRLYYIPGNELPESFK